MALTETQKKANAKYNAKTYDETMFNLSIEKDAKMIQSIENALQNGKSKREWLREIFEISRG